MTSSAFPDVNVWVALAFSGHAHHAAAVKWFVSAPRQDLIFCRFTQLGLLRLLTLTGVMGNRVMTQRQAWKIYDQFHAAGNIYLLPEPHTLDANFRRFANLEMASPNDWADSYLAAFAESASLVLVTFDKALAGKTKHAILLKP
jgi:toxin-antitoxin system PIN domain toxin